MPQKVIVNFCPNCYSIKVEKKTPDCLCWLCFECDWCKNKITFIFKCDKCSFEWNT